MKFACFLLAFCLLKLGAECASDCKAIKTCTGFTKEQKDDQADEQGSEGVHTRYNIPLEQEVGSRGHIGGVKPSKYDLSLKFLNDTYYTGSVDIKFKVMQANTKVIMINHDKVYPTVNYDTIVVNTAACAPTRAARAIAANENCIEKFVYVVAAQTLMIHLKQSLDNNAEYVLSIPNFNGLAAKNDADGARGVEHTQSVYENPPRDNFAVTTIFQMRYARTGFPCFDHPALKATFSLCLERPASIDAASNTLPIAAKSKTTGDSKTDCFETTPKIPTYVFTFSLRKGYTSKTAPVPGSDITVEVMMPSDRANRYDWVMNVSVQTINYLQRITKFKYPLKRLAFIAAYPAPFWGVENFGLVTVEGGHVEAQSDTAYTIIIHEIVHQWVGNVATISYWREICLQEGLTAFLEWMIKADQQQSSLDNKARGTVAQHFGDDYKAPLARYYGRTQHIADTCFSIPPFFFYTVYKNYGAEAIEKFMAKLIADREYGTADLDFYDEAVAVSTGAPNAMRGYIKSWFTESGFPYLMATKKDSSQVLLKQTVSNGTATNRVMPFKYVVSNSATPRQLVLKTSQATVPIAVGADNFFLLDPDYDVFAAKIYSLENYKKIFKAGGPQDPNNVLTADRHRNVVRDFCDGILGNVLPLQEDQGTKEEWTEVVTQVLSSSHVPRSCKCCLSDKAAVESDRNCRWSWNGRCKDLRILAKLGRSFTIGEQ